MKKKLIISGILSIVLFFLFITFSVTYGWYTNVTKIGKIDAETKDITFSYKLDGGESNEFTYSVTNLAFFDVDDSSELKYFDNMHTVIKIELENFSSDVVSYYVEFKSEKIKTTNDTSIAYVMGVITTSETISITDDGTNTVSTYYPGYDKTKDDFTNKYSSVNNLEINTGSNSEAKATLYLHLIGVQEIDTATNEFLFDNEGKPKGYNFTLTIHSEPINDEPDVTEVIE
ncbi:MAG: hypothetical protein IJA65_05725 [Acholeplasmatales bacterium]|nr:hypothetical protein [Acholeplasmatales bacterium]